MDGQRKQNRQVTVAELKGDDPINVGFDADAELRTVIAQELGLIALRKLRFEGQLVQEGAQDWRLEAQLGATATQECVVTLDPVTTRIDASVQRRYLRELPELPSSDEMEMPEDESIEALPKVIDLVRVATEALALELPDYPRADVDEPVKQAFAAPGVTPMSDDDAKPFAALAGLRDKLNQDDD